MSCKNPTYYLFYNVNNIIVPTELQKEYIIFSEHLNCYLQKTYPRYYVGLQLYQSNEDSTQFYVSAAYRDCPGILLVGPVISAEVAKFYEEVWGDSITRTIVFSYLTSTRLL